MTNLTINPEVAKFKFEIHLDVKVLESLANWDFSNIYYDTAEACGIEYDEAVQKVQSDYAAEIVFEGTPNELTAKWYLYSYSRNESTYQGVVENAKEELDSLLHLIAERPSAYENKNDYSENAAGDYVPALISVELRVFRISYDGFHGETSWDIATLDGETPDQTAFFFLVGDMPSMQEMPQIDALIQDGHWEELAAIDFSVQQFNVDFSLL